MSTAEQNPAHQIDALHRAGFALDDVHVDHASGTKASRPQLDLVLRSLRADETLFVHPAGGLLLTQRMANLIARAAVAGVPLPLAATRAGRSDSGLEEPFAATLVNPGAIRIAGAGPSPRLRPHLLPRTVPYDARR